MKAIVYSAVKLCQFNRDGSFGTQSERQKVLKAAMQELSNAGYRHLKDVHYLKSRHINYLVKHWKEQGVSTGTFKNRMSHLRWLATRINKPNIVERSNSSYGIENRKYVDNHSNKAKNLSTSDLERFNDEYLKYSLRLQQEFGLRREESMKFQPKFADRESKIVLKASWCKGGREREIPIRTQSQRDLLNEIHAFCCQKGTKSLIPTNKTYKQQLKAYEYQTARLGLHKNHGLRHAYAQQRYRELTGLECPKCGGKNSKELSEREKKLDFEARMIISAELGHGREEITAVYLGR